MKIPNIKEFFKRKNIETYLDENYHDLYLILLNYPKDITWSEKLYWFYNNITNCPVCDVCGKHLKYKGIMTGYSVTCSKQCKCLSKKVADKIKQTNLQRYGVENPFSSQEVKDQIKQTMIERYGAETPMHIDSIKEKIKQTNLQRYGVENPFSSQEVKDQIKQTMIERYGVEHALQLEKFKKKFIETNINRYGVDYVAKLSDFREKVYNTKRKHNSFHVSKIENQFKQWLEDHNIEYKYQYKCDEYPFMCDFYIPDKHLYIEIQGNWVHGFHPFDQNNQKDIDTLNKWINKNTSYYDAAIETWTINDVKKRQWAKEHNLNWVEVFSIKLEDVINIIKDLI